ncbi:RNA polymerase sigma factor RpoH [Bradyrhizobium sp. CCBAU 51753]|uniref:RNA polymerase sigma factor RpoH n=1 Tax=Bradyrhizobium sp. CCBAU 51753 TaxID=1325100 RepID=UPI00188B115A|nr:RNA polymerase sigma factor RpoH [Bradyrhizobium sp. CCBAU 51753]QOZ27410.1 RNA polymerase sigma factor RpoH [Bradyrhizobium sp. CCBAU 51753]
MQSQSAVVSASVVGATGPRSADFFNSYSAAIRRFDLLEAGREQQLARNWQERRDKRATDELITSHLRLAAKIARQYKGYGLPIADLIAEANLGLVIAAGRFEPGRGSRFSSYAMWWIKATIHDYILRSWSLVKIGTTAAQKKLFFRLRSEMRALAGRGAALTPEAAQTIAERLDVTARDVVEMDTRLHGDLSLNVRFGDEDQSMEWEAMLPDGSPDSETVVAEYDEAAQRSKALHAALDVLTARERRVFEARRLVEQPLTLEELGCELSLSSERVRQIETSAFAKVKRATVSAATERFPARPELC